MISEGEINQIRFIGFRDDITAICRHLHSGSKSDTLVLKPRSSQSDVMNAGVEEGGWLPIHICLFVFHVFFRRSLAAFNRCAHLCFTRKTRVKVTGIVGTLAAENEKGTARSRCQATTQVAAGATVDRSWSTE